MRVMCYATARCATRIGPTSSLTKPLLTRFAATGSHILAIGRWRSCLRACLHRGAFTASFCGCSTSLRTSRRQTTSRTSAMSLTRRSTANAAASTSTSIAAPLAWRVLRLLRFAVPPTLRAVMLLCLVPCNSVLLSLIGTATTFMSVFELKAQ